MWPLIGWQSPEGKPSPGCWAEASGSPDIHTLPCSKPVTSDIGLCATHYREIVGCDAETSPADGANPTTIPAAPG